MKSQIVLGFVCVFAACQPAVADDKPAAETVEVKAKDLVLNVPKTWKQETPKSRLRLTQFAIPAGKDDKEGAELTVFNFGGGSVDANVRRWIGQFQPEKRKTKITTGESTQGKYVFVELSGTYKKPDGPPIQRKTIDMPNARMLAVILVIEGKGVYYLKITGPDKTVAGEAAAFRASFGGNAKTEKEMTGDDETE